MSRTTHRDRPVMTWIPVVDARGRTRMEVRWSLPTRTRDSAPHAA